MSAARIRLAALAGTAVLAACTTAPVSELPQGFAAYQGGEERQAVSFDRVVYQVRRVENKPLANLDFWRVALKERLAKTGYVVTADGDISAKGRPGYFVETTAPRGVADYMYLVALFVHDKDLIVVEAAGELQAYKAQRDKILAAIKASDFAGAAQ